MHFISSEVAAKHELRVKSTVQYVVIPKWNTSKSYNFSYLLITLSANSFRFELVTKYFQLSIHLSGIELCI